MKDLLKLKYLLMSVLFASFVFVSCGDKEEDDIVPEVPVSASEVLVKYLEQDDFVNTYMPAMIDAEGTNSAILAGNAYVMDIRSANDFANGHIEGAVNVALGDIITHVADKDITGYDKVVIACYSGQTASYATSLLRLLGNDNVFCLKFGMSAWNSATANPWKNGTGNTYATQLVTEATAKPEAGELPELDVTATEAEEILAERVNAILGDWGGDAKITAAEVFANKDNYFILNYWSEAHYNLGHIPGAMQYAPKASIKLDADLKTLPTDKPIVVYCYTGQTSAHLAAYLRLLGYDARSLLYGINGMAYDWATANEMTHWDDAYIKEYDLVTK